MAFATDIKRGIALTSAPAVFTAVYEFFKNISLENLFYLVPFLMFICLASMGVSYFAFRKISLANENELTSLGAVFSIYIAVLAVSIPLIVNAFIYFKIQNPYVLLPLLILIYGAVSFAIVMNLLRKSIVKK